MDAIDLISECLVSVLVRLVTTCKGLTVNQLEWRPKPNANNIGFILWHMARHQDTQITKASKAIQDLWVTDGWFRKFSQTPDSPDPGDRMGLKALPMHALDVLLGYCVAVHERSSAYISNVNVIELDQPLSPDRQMFTVGNSLRHLITHQNNHHGQIDYIRGLQDETWDLPVGTGVIVT